MKRLVLVSVHPAPSPQAIPLACGFLKAALHGDPVETEMIDLYLSETADRHLERIAEQQPAAVAFSVYLWNRSACRSMALRLKELLPQALLFCGGPEATADPAGLLAEGCWDFVVAGEGEETVRAVCRGLANETPLTDISGVATLVDGTLKLAPRAPHKDLDSIASPWLSGTLDAAAYPGILWQLSRGCGFSCDFCFDSRDRNGVRRFSLERVESELRHFVDRGVRQVFVLDSTFNQDAQRAKAILRLIDSIAPDIHFHFEVRSEFLDTAMARLFAGITCSLQIGLQSADPAVLKGVGRSFDPTAFARKVGLLNDCGATFGFDLIYGLPGDTLAGFRASLDYALALYPNHLDIFPLALLPGTALAGRARALGLRHLPEPPYTLQSAPGFTAGELVLAARLGRACDIFYTRGRAVAWFNGILDALGLSPSEFLENFSDWLDTQGLGRVTEEELDDERIGVLQRQYLERAFSGDDLKRFLPAALDLATYHHHYATALLSPVTEPTLPPRKLLELPLACAPGVRSASFRYDISELLDAGVADVRGFAKHLRQVGSRAVIYPATDGVRTELLDERYIGLLKRLDGATPAGKAARDAGVPEREAREFLRFAWEEGIVMAAITNKGAGQ